jgi:hypothetical protein
MFGRSERTRLSKRCFQMDREDEQIIRFSTPAAKGYEGLQLEEVMRSGRAGSVKMNCSWLLRARSIPSTPCIRMERDDEQRRHLGPRRQTYRGDSRLGSVKRSLSYGSSGGRRARGHSRRTRPGVTTTALLKSLRNLCVGAAPATNTADISIATAKRFCNFPTWDRERSSNCSICWRANLGEEELEVATTSLRGFFMLEQSVCVRA